VSATNQAIALLNRIQKTQCTSELTKLVEEASSSFGFRAFVVSCYGSTGGEPQLLMSGLPEGLEARLEQGVPAYRMLLSDRFKQCPEPFYWHDLLKEEEAGELRRLLQFAGPAGIEDGYSVPVHMPEGARGTVSFVGARTELNDDERLALQAIAIASVTQFKYLSQPEVVAAAKLTAREREVLKWTAAGKTADATAEILSISVRTVEYHLLNAARKLNTANRTHTVVEALRSRQLSL